MKRHKRKGKMLSAWDELLKEMDEELNTPIAENVNYTWPHESFSFTYIESYSPIVYR